MKKALYIAACVMVIITNNTSNAFRKGMFIHNLEIRYEQAMED